MCLVKFWILLLTFQFYNFYNSEMETYLHVKCEKVLRSVSVRFAITSGDFGPMIHRVVNKEVTSWKEILVRTIDETPKHLVQLSTFVTSSSIKSTCKNTDPSSGKWCLTHVKERICWMEGDINMYLLYANLATEQSFS